MYTQNDQRGRIITDKHLIKSEITFRVFIRLWYFRWSRGLYLSKNSFECSLSNVLSILGYSTTSTDLERGVSAWSESRIAKTSVQQYYSND